MRYLLCIGVLVSGCTFLKDTPTTVDPVATDATNIGLCLLQAANGSCSAPCPPSVAAAASCAYGTATTTVSQDQAALKGCAEALISAKALVYAGIAQQLLCARSSTLFPVPTVPVLPTK